MYDNLDIEDVKTLINKLMSFIVLDGKNFVNEKQREDYVKSYLSLFVKMINEPDNEDKNISKAAVLEHIFKDMAEYVN